VGCEEALRERNSERDIALKSGSKDADKGCTGIDRRYALAGAALYLRDQRSMCDAALLKRDGAQRCTMMDGRELRPGPVRGRSGRGQATSARDSANAHVQRL